MRQTIALVRGDLDLLIALEAAKKPHMQHTLGIAEALHGTGRAAEALEWVRKPGRRSFGEDDDLSPLRIALEARILEDTGARPAAQALRWRCFEARLSADILRDYLKGLPDFDDMEVEDRAFAISRQHANPESALQFFLDWQRLDLAADLIVSNRQHWNGGDWTSFPKSLPCSNTITRSRPQSSTAPCLTTS